MTQETSTEFVEALEAEVNARVARIRELDEAKAQELQGLEQTEGRIFGLLTTTSMLLGKPTPQREVPTPMGAMQGPPTLQQHRQAQEGTLVAAIVNLLRQHGTLKVTQIEGYLKGQGRGASYGSIYATLSKASDRFEKVDPGTFRLRVDTRSQAG